MLDVLIVGGGPAGLSAALVLGRCGRRVVVCDDGAPRNGAARATHGFLTRDGTSPRDLLCQARRDLVPYGVEVIEQTVVDATCAAAAEGDQTRFEVRLADQRCLQGRKLLLATGVRDVMPEIAGLRELYGRVVHHCPYCDGWEHRGQALVAYGPGRKASGLALALRTWSADVTVCTDGRRIGEALQCELAAAGIPLRGEPIVRMEPSAHGDWQGARIVFAAGPPLECGGFFFNTGQVQRSELPRMLGCHYSRRGHIRTGRRQGTNVPGLFLAGDADGDVQFVIVAAAEGATAATAINRELQEEDRRTRATAPGSVA